MVVPLNVTLDTPPVTVVPVSVLPKLAAPDAVKNEAANATAPVVVSPVCRVTALPLRVRVLALENHADVPQLVKETAPIAVGCVAAK